MFFPPSLHCTVYPLEGRRCILHNLARCLFLLQSENRGNNMKRTAGNMAMQPSDRFVCGALMSEKLVPMKLAAMLFWVFVEHWLPGSRGAKTGGIERVGEHVQKSFSQFWQALDSWTTGSSFSSQWGWNFKLSESRVVNDWGSQNNLGVCLFFPPFPYFSCPTLAPLQHALVWKKTGFNCLRYSKHGRIV